MLCILDCINKVVDTQHDRRCTIPQCAKRKSSLTTVRTLLFITVIWSNIPLIPLISRGLQVPLLLILTHSIPNLVSLRIDPLVVDFCAYKYEEVVQAYSNKDLVSFLVKRLVFLPVDVRRDDRTSLNTHVVQRGSHSACSHGTGIAGSDGDENSVYVGVADQEGSDRPARPRAYGLGYELEGEDERKRPNLGAKGDKKTFVEFLREPGPEEELQNEENIGWDL
jgi:hypothetical protein